ncbi:glycosyl transferase [Kocuria sp. CNJ-770]|uniref:nucleotide disphospho-sugar-binding domain-containing protein n=1 Tax=Kocuria sp. CNJ-770 TaxID=1904964 RepID=UPI0009660CB5|nr:nucleotide disphospho-sugar-binding domain-containing protein [Kocuria sp. CNJ-770]OLT13789.1 glycosyl transferase [Kocuria sp. CNJ-770]
MMLLTSGTRGDVEPFAALARYAAARGHEVRLGVPDRSGADLSGLDTVRLGVDFHRLLRTDGLSPRAALRHYRTEVRPGMRRMLSAAVRETLAFGPDLVVHHPLILTAPALADALGVPRVLTEFVPVATPTREFSAPGGPTVSADLGRFNRATYAVPRGAARLFRADVEGACAALPGGRAPSPRSPSRATLIGASPHLLPRPADWPAAVHLTGAWHDEALEPATEPVVDRFVRGGPYLVATFGSMRAGDAQARARAVVAGARAHGLRTLLLSGWGGLVLPEDHPGEDVLVVPSAPLGPVLRGAAAAVHHGGAGTVHTVAREGVPSVVVPFLADQPFWAGQLHRLGIASAPVPHRRLTAETLVPALGEALARGERAARLGRAMRQERGLRTALDVLTGL